MTTPSLRQILPRLRVFLASALTVSVAWEILQTPLYRGTTLVYGVYTQASLLEPQYWVVLAYAALCDVFYIALIYLCVALFTRDFLWLSKPLKTGTVFFMILLSLAVAELIELRGLHSGHWSYSALMPMVPALGIGWFPFVQLAVTGFVSLYVTRRLNGI